VVEHLSSKCEALSSNPTKKKELRPGMVAQACNPSNSGDKNWEDRGSKPAQAKRLQDSISYLSTVAYNLATERRPSQA
jgi:hypothetical protein